MAFDSNGAGNISVSFGGSDVLRHHFWDITTSFDTTVLDAAVAVSYVYGGLYPSMDLFVARIPGLGARFARDELTTFKRENIFVSTGISVGIPHIEHPFSFWGDLSLRVSWDPDPPGLVRHDPGASAPFESEDGYRVSLAFGWNYNHVESYSYSISPEDGVRFGMAFTYYPPVFGDLDTGWTASGFLDWYVPMPRPLLNHVLAFKYEGAISGGDLADTFRLGGLPEQDIVFDLINDSGIYGSYLRGFDAGAFSGDTYHLLTTEYRFPIADIFWAPGTIPVWFRRVSGALFSDVGLIYEGSPSVEDIRASLGAELQLTTTLFYATTLRFRLGFAGALTEPRGSRAYLIIGSNL